MGKMKRSTALLLVLALLGTLVLSACGGSKKTAPKTGDKPAEQPAAKPVTISVWWMENRDDPINALKEIVASFEKENPGIKIDFQSYSWADVKPKVLAAINAGSAPDLIQSIPDFTVAIKETGAIQQVDDIVKEIDSKYKFYPSQLEPYNYDSHYWAVPVFGMANMLYYRKDVFEKAGLQPPKTWDELLSAAKALNKDGMSGIALPTSNSMYTDQILYNFMITNGGDLYDKENKLAFNTPENTQALKFYQDLSKYSPAESANWTWQEATEHFVGGKSAMVLILGVPVSFWYNNQADKRTALGAVPPPVGPKGTPGTTSYSNGFMLTSKDAAKREAAKKFLVYLHEPERNGAFLAKALPGLFLPVTEATGKSQSYFKNPVLTQYKEIIDAELKVNGSSGKLFGFTHGVPTKSIGPIAGSNVMGAIVNKMLLEKMTPEAAAKFGQTELERVAGGK